MRVIAIGARDPERARALADRLGVPEAGDYEMVLNHPDVDLVYIPLPSTVQAHWAVRALQAGKHVLCEKPLSANGTTAARDRRRRGCRGQTRLRGFPLPAARLHAPAARGARLGCARADAERVEFDYSIPHFVVQPGNIRLDGDLGGGSFMDVGCYAVDLIRAAWGEPAVISAEAVLYADDPRVDLQTDAVLRACGRHPGSRPLVVHRRRPGQHVAAGHRDGRVTSRRRASSCRSGARELRVTAGDRVLIEEKAVDGENSYARQLEHLVAVLRDGSPSPLDAALGVGTMTVVDEVYRAAGLQPR